jgi:hypothetical protein
MGRTCHTLLTLLTLVPFAPGAGALAATSPPLDAEGWRQDLAVIARELPARHPNLFHRMSHAAWDSAVADVDRRLPSMTRDQAIVAFMQLVALSRDGHTSIHPLFDPGLRLRYYPLRLHLFEDGLFVRSAAPEYRRLVGARVLRIGRVTADRALAAAATTIPAENDWWPRAWAPERLMIPELLDGLGLVDDPERLTLVVERNGHKETVTVSPGGRIEPRGHDPSSAIDRGGWIDMRSTPPPLWQRNAGAPYWWEYVARDRMLYVSYRAVIDAGSEAGMESNPSFWRRVFAVADSLQVERLVLDLRENIGGNSFYNRQVVRGLIQRTALDRKDRLFVVIGPRTFSAAMNLALDLEHWTNATFVGEPTGNATFFYGDHTQLLLPHSGITVAVSSLPWHPYDPRDRRDFLAPAIYAPMTSVDYRAGVDPALRAIAAAATAVPFTDAIEAAAVRGDSAEVDHLLERERGKVANRFRSLEAELNRLGYALLSAGRVPAALVVFRANTRAYPGSANTWDSLGEALADAGRGNEAIAAYRRALEVNPELGSARAALQRLGAEATGAPGH